MKVYIIVPCYNEAQNLTTVINNLKSFGQVVVVDDGSTDNSFQVAKNCGVIALKHFLNRGQGAALETGDQYALKQGADVIIHFDADGQHQASDLPKLIEPIVNQKAEVTLGSRFLNVDQTPWLKKWLILKPAIVFQNILLGSKLTDAHNGLRAFSRQALSKIKITQDGMAHSTEIIEQIIKNKIKYQEVPVTITYHEFGQGFLSGLKILSEIIFGKLHK